MKIQLEKYLKLSKINIYRHHGVRKEGLDFHGSESPTEEEINKCYKIYEESIL